MSGSIQVRLPSGPADDQLAATAPFDIGLRRVGAGACTQLGLAGECGRSRCDYAGRRTGVCSAVCVRCGVCTCVMCARMRACACVRARAILVRAPSHGACAPRVLGSLRCDMVPHLCYTAPCARRAAGAGSVCDTAARDRRRHHGVGDGQRHRACVAPPAAHARGHARRRGAATRRHVVHGTHTPAEPTATAAPAQPLPAGAARTGRVRRRRQSWWAKSRRSRPKRKAPADSARLRRSPTTRNRFCRALPCAHSNRQPPPAPPAVRKRPCTASGLVPATSAPGLGSCLPHLHRDSARACHICTETRLAPCPQPVQAPIQANPVRDRRRRSFRVGSFLVRSIDRITHRSAAYTSADGEQLVLNELGATVDTRRRLARALDIDAAALEGCLRTRRSAKPSALTTNKPPPSALCHLAPAGGRDRRTSGRAVRRRWACGGPVLCRA
jgi:hypothetical protein